MLSVRLVRSNGYRQANTLSRVDVASARDESRVENADERAFQHNWRTAPAGLAWDYVGHCAHDETAGARPTAYYAILQRD